MKTLSMVFDWTFSWNWLLTKRDKQTLTHFERTVNKDVKDAEQFLRRLRRVETETIVSEMEKLK